MTGFIRIISANNDSIFIDTGDHDMFSSKGWSKGVIIQYDPVHVVFLTNNAVYSSTCGTMEIKDEVTFVTTHDEWTFKLKSGIYQAQVFLDDEENFEYIMFSLIK